MQLPDTLAIAKSFQKPVQRTTHKYGDFIVFTTHINTTYNREYSHSELVSFLYQCLIIGILVVLQVNKKVAHNHNTIQDPAASATTA